MNIHEIKNGDYLLTVFDGVSRRGEVVDINHHEKQVCVYNGIQDFWYPLDQLSPLSVNDEELSNLKFHKQINEDGTVKYSKGAFRMLIPSQDDFSRMELWYRDESRHIQNPIHLNELQNHFLEMTKVHLDDSAFD